MAEISSEKMDIVAWKASLYTRGVPGSGLPTRPGWDKFGDQMKSARMLANVNEAGSERPS
ncbi:MAG: hypothetical protein NVSMB9_06890 [Isosphaeraceae bacterium]